MKGKRLRATVLVVLGSLIPLCGCALYGNDRSDTRYVYSGEADGKVVFYGVESTYYDSFCLTYDPQTGELALKEITEEPCFADPAVLDGNTFPRHSFEASEGYEGLSEKILALDGRENPYVQAYALKAEDGSAYGFYNVYSSATGFLSGGGQIDVSKITKGVLFAYSPETDELTVLDELEEGCVVAFNQTRCVYYCDRFYYSKEIGGASAVRLCEDGAFDTGATNYSYAKIYFNEAYCIFKFHRGYGDDKKDYDDFLLYGMNGEKLSKLRVPSNFS